MKKIITVLLTIAAILSSVSTLAESMPIEGKVISTQSYLIVSQAKGITNYSVDADAPFENATLVMTPLATHIAGMESRGVNASHIFRAAL